MSRRSTVHVVRREPEYAKLRGGQAELGLAPTSKLPDRGAGPRFTQERLASSIRRLLPAGNDPAAVSDDRDSRVA